MFACAAIADKALSVTVSSAGRQHGDKAAIVIDGKDESPNGRGVSTFIVFVVGHHCCQ